MQANVVTHDQLERFIPRSATWSSVELLASVRRCDLTISGHELECCAQLFEFDMNTEYDAQNFAAKLRELQASGLEFSPAFQAFADTWRRDEWNHYLGYRRLYALLSGQSEDTLHAQVSARHADFGQLAGWLSDEFSICVVLAFDEIFTARSCRQDFALFESLGHPNLTLLIRRIARDEAFHFLNLIDVLQRCHAHRLDAVDHRLDELIAWDIARRPYTGTFVLDHDDSRFTRASLERSKSVILRKLQHTPRPRNHSAGHVWQEQRPLR